MNRYVVNVEIRQFYKINVKAKNKGEAIKLGEEVIFEDDEILYDESNEAYLWGRIVDTKAEEISRGITE